MCTSIHSYIRACTHTHIHTHTHTYIHTHTHTHTHSHTHTHLVGATMRTLGVGADPLTPDPANGP